MSKNVVFWDTTERSPMTGETMMRAFRRSLEENSFSQAGLEYCESRELEKAFRRQQRNSVAFSGQAADPRSQLDERLRQQCSQKMQTRDEQLSQLVEWMGLHVDHSSALPPANTMAATGDPAQDFPSAIAVANVAPSEANDKTSSGDMSTPTTSVPPQGAPTLGAKDPIAPQSALAKLVMKAKAKQEATGGPTEPSVSGAAPSETVPPAPAPRQAGKRARETEEDGVKRARNGGAVGRTLHNDGDDDDDAEDFAVALPAGVGATADDSATAGAVAPIKHPSQMTREEFLGQFKRAPRRGEVGQSAEEIAKAQKLGYVMSGSRSIGAQMYVDRIQRQLHEREAGKLQQQFRKVEDDRMDSRMVQDMLQLLESQAKNPPRE